MYTIKRHLEAVLERRFKNNICLSVNGARQVGKSTLIKHLFPEMPRVNFDNRLLRESAMEDEAGFLDNRGTPLFIDEAQKVPTVFEAIKDKIESNELGYSSYVLSGSQKLKLHAGEETLAGKVSINEMTGLSLREIFDVEFYEKFIPNEEYLSKRRQCLKNYDSIWEIIHRGQYPELYMNPNKEWEDFYQSYVNTYIERDVADEIDTKNILTFIKFMTSVASRTGNILTYTSIASEVGINEKTVAEWISILERSGIIYLLKPYYSSHLKRAIKSPKVYFRDTGLACYLTRWLTPETAKNGAMSGALFETFVVDEIIKTYANAGIKYDFSVFYYRGRDKKKVRIETSHGVIEEEVEGEIDLIIQEGDDLYPIEIKETGTPRPSMASTFDVLDKEVEKHRRTGIILCTVREETRLKEGLICLPISFI